jgi:hypothetical protein
MDLSYLKYKNIKSVDNFYGPFLIFMCSVTLYNITLLNRLPFSLFIIVLSVVSSYTSMKNTTQIQPPL